MSKQWICTNCGEDNTEGCKLTVNGDSAKPEYCMYTLYTGHAKWKPFIPTKQPKIKFRLEVFEETLVFQILYMDERFRALLHEHEFTASNGISVRSINTPELYLEKGAYVYLLGKSDEKDTKIAIEHFDSNTERDKYKDKLIEALKDWAENWEGFKERSEPVPVEKKSIYPNIYTF